MRVAVGSRRISHESQRWLSAFSLQDGASASYRRWNSLDFLPHESVNDTLTGDIDEYCQEVRR